MMSKKWAFSLTSLITIFALAFMVPTAYSAFDIDSISAVDVSEAGDTQIEYGVANTITIKFKEVVTIVAPTTAGPEFALADISVVAYNEYGGVVTAPTVSTLANLNAAQPNGKDYTVSLASQAAPTDDAARATTPAKIVVTIAADAVEKAGDSAEKNTAKSATFFYVGREPGEDGNNQPDGSTVDPKVISITRSTPIGSTVASAFIEETVTGTFTVKIVLSEKPKDAFNAASLDVKGGTVDSVVAGVSFERASDNTTPPASEGGYTQGNGSDPTHVPLPTGRDAMYYPYLATITPDGKEDMVTIKVNNFIDLVKLHRSGTTVRMPGQYRTPPDSSLDAQPNGRERLKVKVAKDAAKSLDAGQVVKLTNKRVIPANGYLIVATNPFVTGINLPDEHDKDDNTPKIDKRTPAEQRYNVIDVDLPDLEAFLITGGTIDLVSPDAGLSISEIMWGSDASITPNYESQWIEIKNSTGAHIPTGDGTHKLIFYRPNEALPDMSVAANNIQDRVGTVDDDGRFWSIAGIGQSGRSGHEEKKADLTAVVPTQELISMYRVDPPDGEGALLGNTQAAWAQSTKPAVNIVGANRVGSPGDEQHEGFTPPLVVETKPTPVTIPPATAGDIMITEIMVDTGNGRLPQWIELANVSGAEKTLDGWSVEISNDTADTDVVGSSLSINLRGTLGVGGGENLGGTLGKTLLLVAWGGRSSENLDGSDRVINVSGQLKQKGRYTLLSPMGFMIKLLPPQTTGIEQPGDTVGNLGAAEAWDLEMDDTGRSSLIRKFDAGVAEMGMEADGWVLASSTSLLQAPATWYGSDEDAGTPGVIGGGPLPVELSHFRPARDKATGAVVITWATQSELNNAGFFIKRSQQRTGEFKVINATIIAGAGTTSEKQFYTYTDTTAQPNVVYYYQIEDVSLDGNRQTLTRGIRLKGHVGAAGKATTTWGELKASHE